MTQKKKSITEVKQNREWREEIFKTEEEGKKGFATSSEALPSYTNIQLLFSPPQLGFATAAWVHRRPQSRGQEALGTWQPPRPPNPRHSFLSSVVMARLHVFLDRKLKLVRIKSNIHASSNKPTVCENVNDHIFIWQIKHDAFRPMTWKHCDLNWNEQNWFWRRKRKEVSNEIPNKNHWEWVGRGSWKDNIEWRVLVHLIK